VALVWGFRGQHWPDLFIAVKARHLDTDRILASGGILLQRFCPGLPAIPSDPEAQRARPRSASLRELEGSSGAGPPTVVSATQLISLKAKREHDNRDSTRAREHLRLSMSHEVTPPPRKGQARQESDQLFSRSTQHKGSDRSARAPHPRDTPPSISTRRPRPGSFAVRHASRGPQSCGPIRQSTAYPFTLSTPRIWLPRPRLQGKHGRCPPFACSHSPGRLLGTC
jgi:hypothetical protein